MKPPHHNSHCSYCGSKFPEGLDWPRTCPSCTHISYINPTPVGVAVAPVRMKNGRIGVIGVRRNIPPRKGQIALPGGFLDIGESWQEGTVRELWEETAVTRPADTVTLINVHSTPDGRNVLIFGATEPIDEDDIPPFEESHEATERVILTEPTELAFPLHTQILAQFLASLDNDDA